MTFASPHSNAQTLIPGHIDTATEQFRLWLSQMMVFIGICIILLPITWLFLTAFKLPRDVYSLQTAFNFTPTLENLQTIFEHPWNLGHKILNSFAVAGGTVLIAIPMRFLGLNFVSKKLFSFWLLHRNSYLPRSSYYRTF